MSKEKIRDILRNLYPRINREFYAEVKGFFGSQARGDAALNSDLEVLVHFHDQAGLYELIGLGDFLESVFHCKVDIVSTRAIADQMKKHILNELVRI